MFKKYKKNFKSILTRKRSTGFNISKPLWNTLWKQERGTKTFKRKIILSFVTQYQPSVPNLTHILMKHWQMIENQPFLRQIYKEPPIISYKWGRSLKDILVKAWLWERLNWHIRRRQESGLSTMKNKKVKNKNWHLNRKGKWRSENQKIKKKWKSEK